MEGFLATLALLGIASVSGIVLSAASNSRELVGIAVGILLLCIVMAFISLVVEKMLRIRELQAEAELARAKRGPKEVSSEGDLNLP